MNSIEVYGALIDATVQIEETITNETAIGANDGSITVNVSGGTPPYEYLWTPGGETTPTISNLTAGLYTVTVTDSEGCQTTAQFQVFTDGVQREIPCNTDDPVAITSEGFTDLVVEQNTDGVCVLPLCGAFDEDNLINVDQDDFALARTTIGLGVTHTFRVTDETVDEQFEAGGFAGFLIENSSILQVDLLNSITVRTYLDGVLQEESDTESLVAVGTTLLGTSDQFNVGFFTSQDYDAIEISLSSLLNIGSETRIYHAVTSRFCPGPELECNTPTALAKPDFPVRIVDENTGLSGGITLGSIDNTENAIDSNPTNFASINFLASVGGQASISVKDEFATYSENTFAGFDIENVSLLNLELLNSITVTTYLDGTEVESNSGASELLAISSALLLTSDEAVRVGFISTQDFDEVQLTIEQGVSLNLGTTRVFGAVLTRLCEGPLECDETFVVSNPDYPVIINNENTGVEGVACVGCEVDDSQNVISEDSSDFGLINVVAGVAATASISVEDAIVDYPTGTITGFVIRDRNDLLEANLLNSLTITTYLNGVEQEVFTNGTSLLILDVLNITNIGPVPPDGAYAIGFEVTEEFDQVQLTVASVAGVLNSIEVYGQFVDITGTDICNANIAIIKEGVLNDENADGCSDVGETIDYTFTVTNEGTSALEDVTVTDPLLGGLIAGPVLGDTDSDGELDVDETWIYTASYAINQNDIETGNVTNQATATGTAPDSTVVTDLSDDNSELEDDPTVTTLCQNADIALIKVGTFNDEDQDGCSDVGETISYVFTVSNNGNVTLSDVTVTDPLVTVNGGPIATLDVGVSDATTFTATYTITQADIDAGEFENQATATGTAPDSTVVTDLSDDNSELEDDPTVTTLCQNADIALIKVGTFNDEDQDGCSDVGETITYNFTVINTGNTTITNIDIDDPLVNVQGGPITLAPGATDTSTFTATYLITLVDINNGSVTNQAEVTGLDPQGTIVSDFSDDNSPVEDDPTVTELCNNGIIALIKIGTPTDENNNGCVDLGETIVYDFVVTNLGNVTLTNVIVTDPLVTVIGGPVDLVAGDSDTETFSAIYTVTQDDVNAGNVTNQATAEGLDPLGNIVSDLSDDNSNFEDDTTVTVLCQMPMISLEKSGIFNDENGDGAAQAGETISYFFAVTNTGSVTVFNITLDDPLPGIIIEGGPIAVLEPGNVDNTTFTATYTVTEADIANQEVVNQATTTGVDANGNEVNDTSDDPIITTNADPDGDGDPDDPTVTILPSELVQFEIFNGVTPNGDGAHDYFQILGIEGFPVNNVKIYNRWGVLVFETDGYGGTTGDQNVFTGRSNGRSTISEEKDLPTGTYFYILTFPSDPSQNPEKDNYTGYLYLNR